MPLCRNGLTRIQVVDLCYPRLYDARPKGDGAKWGSGPDGGIPSLGKEAPLNRKELVDAIQKHTSVARTDVDKVLGSLIQHTQVAVKKGERVALVGFGTFERQDRKARTARNPRSGAPVKVKATKVPRFRAGQGFKDVVAGKATAPKLTPVKSAAKATTAKAAATARATVSRASTAKASTAKKAPPRNSAAKPAKSRGKAKSGKKK
jgi:DNA-binding protein HU-beta